MYQSLLKVSLYIFLLFNLLKNILPSIIIIAIAYILSARLQMVMSCRLVSVRDGASILWKSSQCFELHSHLSSSRVRNVVNFTTSFPTTKLLVKIVLYFCFNLDTEGEKKEKEGQKLDSTSRIGGHSSCEAHIR